MTDSTDKTSNPIPEPRRWRPGAVWVVPAIALMALFAGDSALAFPTTCPWKLVTDLPCGGCGMTRAFVALAKGDFVAAIGFNPLSPCVAIAMVVWVAATARRRLTGRSMPHVPTWLAWLALVAFVVLHIGRALSLLPGPG